MPIVFPEEILWGILKSLPVYLPLYSLSYPTALLYSFLEWSVCSTDLWYCSWNAVQSSHEAHISIHWQRRLWQLRSGTTVWETRTPSQTATAVYFWYRHPDAFFPHYSRHGSRSLSQYTSQQSDLCCSEDNTSSNCLVRCPYSANFSPRVEPKYLFIKATEQPFWSVNKI